MTGSGGSLWKADALTVDGDKPAVYYYLSHARVKGEPVLQINYAFWYPAGREAGRPQSNTAVSTVSRCACPSTPGAAVHDRSHEQLRLLPRLHPGKGPGGSDDPALLRE